MKFEIEFSISIWRMANFGFTIHCTLRDLEEVLRMSPCPSESCEAWKRHRSYDHRRLKNWGLDHEGRAVAASPPEDLGRGRQSDDELMNGELWWMSGESWASVGTCDNHQRYQNFWDPNSRSAQSTSFSPQAPSAAGAIPRKCRCVMHVDMNKVGDFFSGLGPQNSEMLDSFRYIGLELRINCRSSGSDLRAVGGRCSTKSAHLFWKISWASLHARCMRYCTARPAGSPGNDIVVFTSASWWWPWPTRKESWKHPFA